MPFGKTFFYMFVGRLFLGARLSTPSNGKFFHAILSGRFRIDSRRRAGGSRKTVNGDAKDSHWGGDILG
jgi:hypothetical protein